MFPNHYGLTLSFTVLHLCICECVFICELGRVCAVGIFMCGWKGLEQSEKSFNVLNCHNLELAHTYTHTHTLIVHLAWGGWLNKEVYIGSTYGNWWAIKSITINLIVCILLYNCSSGNLAWCSYDFARPCLTVRLCPLTILFPDQNNFLIWPHRGVLNEW